MEIVLCMITSWRNKVIHVFKFIDAGYLKLMKHFILIVQGQAKYFWQNCLINNNFSTVVHLRLPHTFLVVTKPSLFGILVFRFKYVLYSSILFALRCIMYHGLEAIKLCSIVFRALYSIGSIDLFSYCTCRIISPLMRQMYSQFDVVKCMSQKSQ